MTANKNNIVNIAWYCEHSSILDATSCKIEYIKNSSLKDLGLKVGLGLVQCYTPLPSRSPVVDMVQVPGWLVSLVILLIPWRNGKCLRNK